MILLLIPAVGLAVAIGVLFGWKWVFAPLLAAVLLRISLASLRSLVPGPEEADAAAVVATPVRDDERTLFWCEECGTEVVLLVRGTERAPSHCGQRMHERTEVRNN